VFVFFQIVEHPKMARRHLILLDATLESHAPFFTESPIFQRWLHSYNNIPDALNFISQINLPHRIEVYISRDNILDNGLALDTDGQMRNLIQTFNDLQTILHVSIFVPTLNTDLEQQIRNMIPQPRLLKDIISVVDLHSRMCTVGINYLTEEITRCIHTKDVNPMLNLQKGIEDLMEYLETIMNDRKKLIEALVEQRSNQLGQEPS